MVQVKNRKKETQDGKKPKNLDLERVREEIDDVDRKMLVLLNRRAELSKQVGRLKADVSDSVFKPFREKEVLDKLAAINTGPLPDKHLRSIYREILSSSRRLQRPQKIVYLGPEGTFSFFAGVEFLGHSSDFEPKSVLPEVFKAVDDGEADLGVIPLENSLQGTVGQSLDLFFQYEVFIQAEIYCKISHCLIGSAANLSDVKVVYSHPQALNQCAGWLRANLPKANVVPAESTAAAAAHVNTDPSAAAIGHKRLADMLGMNVLAEGVEDMPDNWTRFLIIGPTPGKEGKHDKTSMLFTVPDKPGSLVNVLNLLAREGINMKKLESRPLRGEKWKYVFFVDVECDMTSDNYKDFLEELKAACYSLRVLGSYPAGPQLDMAGTRARS